MASKPKSRKTKQLSKSKPTRPAAKAKSSAGRATKTAYRGSIKKSGAKKADRPSSKAKSRPAPPPPPVRPSGAVIALEAAIRLMYAEDYDKAVKTFKKVLVDFPDEPEIQASVRARMQACEKKIQERARSIFKSADDHYNVAVAFLNGGDLASAVTHLQSALKLSPKADHVLYALAAAHALQGNKDSAISFLKQAIGSRPENRFQAGVDPDFASLSEDQSFKDLMMSPEK